MSLSTDALFWWGYCLNSEGYELPESVIALLHAECMETHPDEVVAKLLKGSGVKLVYHCSGDYAMYGLAVSASYVWSWRGNPKQVKQSMMHVHPEWVEKLKKAAESIGWPTDQEPGFWLASYMG